MVEQARSLVVRDFEDAADVAKEVAQRTAPYRTGRLRRSIFSSRRARGFQVVAGVFYASYQERRRMFLRRGLQAGLALLRSRGYR